MCSSRICSAVLFRSVIALLFEAFIFFDLIKRIYFIMSSKDLTIMSAPQENALYEEEEGHSKTCDISTSEWKKLLLICCRELFEAQQENEKINARLTRALNHIQVRAYLLLHNK